MITVTHLIDDTSQGGVMRVLETLQGASGEGIRHVVRPVARARLPRGIEGDVIVSHLSVSWRSLPSLVALRAAAGARPLVHVEHSYTEGFAALKVSRPGRFATLLRLAYSLFDRVVAVSEAQRDWLERRGLAPAGRLAAIRSAVDVAPFSALPAPGRVRTIGAIGRLHEQKGFDVLIDAFRALPDPDLRLRIVGDGPERAALEARAAGDARILFAGPMAPVQAMAGMDAVAMPSRWEAYGLVGLEARAAGRPLLAAPVDGLRDQIGMGAIRVDAGRWGAAISALVAAGPGARGGMRAEAAREAAAFARGWRDLVGGLCAVRA